ncbi:MAG: hypothetical protein JO043_06295 [Candidatus Eremiobacteraeota bacterium]|nr:hypothetical protein [Candidatus Eremiobacteraeota bacterium]
MLFIGIDGGQSGSRAALADESGTILARVEGPALFSAATGTEPTLLADIAALVRRLRDESGAQRDVVRSLVAGISGQDAQARIPRAAIAAEEARLVHDSEIAHAAALAGYRGILVIAGSGSVALGTDAAAHAVRRGGWGTTFGDEGSAFWIARAAIGAAMRASEDGIATSLIASICRHFEVPSLRALQKGTLRRTTSPLEIARFAARVLEQASDGDAVAARVRDGAAEALCELVVRVEQQLGGRSAQSDTPVSYAGRVFDDAGLRDAWRERVVAAIPKARVVAPRAEPVTGALILAYRDAGRDFPPALLRSATS